LVDSRDAGLAIIRADPQAIWLLCWNRSPAEQACAIELIPADNPESRRIACAYAVKEIVASVEQMITRVNATAH
jgi:hypothetical protein